MEDYEKLLNEAYERVKPIEAKGVCVRFEVPKVEGHIEGNKTIITNFSQICNYLRRNKEHVAKFLQRELATPSIIEGDRLILNNKRPSAKVNEKIQLYVNEFVLCKECQKPDTELVKQDRLVFMHCLACGAKHPVRAKIQ